MSASDDKFADQPSRRASKFHSCGQRKGRKQIMKAIRVHAYGGPEQLREEEAPDPKADSGKVLVRIRAASVNPIDFKLASGNMRQIMPINFPWIPGGDFSGVVADVGPGVT